MTRSTQHRINLIRIGLLSLLITLSVFTAAAVVPQKINYQGYLMNSSGNPINTTVSLTFYLYAAETGGTALWTETQNNVAVTNGVFNVLLGSVTPITLNFSQQYWLETRVNGETLSPRRPLVSVGYAFRAEYANNLPIAAYAGGDQSVTLSMSAQVVRSVSITAPSAGTFIVTATGYGKFDSSNHDVFRCAITTGTAIDYDYLIIADDYNSSNTGDTDYVPFAGTRGYSLSAGTYTFNLVCDTGGWETSAAHVGDTSMHVLFFPSSGAGKVAMPASDDSPPVVFNPDTCRELLDRIVCEP